TGHGAWRDMADAHIGVLQPRMDYVLIEPEKSRHEFRPEPFMLRFARTNPDDRDGPFWLESANVVLGSDGMVAYQELLRLAAPQPVWRGNAQEKLGISSKSLQRYDGQLLKMGLVKAIVGPGGRKGMVWIGGVDSKKPDVHPLSGQVVPGHPLPEADH